MKKYVTLTTVSQFRIKYVVSFEKLQELNPEHPLSDEDAILWSEECVSYDELEEVGQTWLGENLVEASVTDEHGACAAYVRENAEYVKEAKLKPEDILQKIDGLLQRKIQSNTKKDIVL